MTITSHTTNVHVKLLPGEDILAASVQAFSNSDPVVVLHIGPVAFLVSASDIETSLGALERLVTKLAGDIARERSKAAQS